MFPFQFKISDWAGVAFLGILTSKWYILTSHTHSVNVYTLCTKNCEIFQTLTALALGYLRCAEIFTLSLSLTGLLLSALNVLSSSSQAPRSGRGALRRGPERGLFHQKFAEKMQKLTRNMKNNRKFNFSIAKKCWRFLAEILRLKNGAKECIV